MQIKFKSTEHHEVELLPREKIVAWLEANGWVAKPMQQDWYWETWRGRGEQQIFWVNVPAPESSSFGYKLPEEIVVKQQGDMLESLQLYMEIPAMDIYREMVGELGDDTCKDKLLTEFWNSVGEDNEETISDVNFSDFEEIIRIMSDEDARGYWHSMEENYDAEGRSAVLEVICENWGKGI